MDPLNVLELALATVKASGASEATVELEGLKLHVKFSIEGPIKLDDSAPDAPARTPIRPTFKAG